MVLMKKRPRNTSSHLLHQSNDSSSEESTQICRPKTHVKPLQTQPESQTQTQTRKRKEYVCEFCNKEFSCGKAYGGHVRIHSNEYRKKGKTKKKTTPRGKLKLKLKKKEIEETRADVEVEIRCCICGKEFETMNSLFGHMRRHPERSWKGIRPPPPAPVEKFKVSSSSSANFDDDDDDDDVMSRSTVMNDVAEDVQEGACNLMMLSCGKTQKDEVKQYSRKGKEIVLNDDDDDDEDDDSDDGDEKGYIVHRKKIKREIEVKEEKKENGNGKRSLEFDLNKPCKIEE